MNRIVYAVIALALSMGGTSCVAAAELTRVPRKPGFVTFQAKSESVRRILGTLYRNHIPMQKFIIEGWGGIIGEFSSSVGHWPVKGGKAEENEKPFPVGAEDEKIDFSYSGRESDIMTSFIAILGSRFVVKKHPGSQYVSIINRVFFDSKLWPLNDPLDPDMTSSSMTMAECYRYLQAHHHFSYVDGSWPNGTLVHAIAWKGFFEGATVRDMVVSMASTLSNEKFITCYTPDFEQFRKFGEGLYQFPTTGSEVEWSMTEDLLYTFKKVNSTSTRPFKRQISTFEPVKTRFEGIMSE